MSGDSWVLGSECGCRGVVGWVLGGSSVLRSCVGFVGRMCGCGLCFGLLGVFVVEWVWVG